MKNRDDNINYNVRGIQVKALIRILCPDFTRLFPLIDNETIYCFSDITDLETQLIGDKNGRGNSRLRGGL